MSEVGTIFALPWLITWFSHVLPDYEDVVRLFDFFLAQPPMMPIYLAATIVLHRSEDVRQVDCDLASVHGILARIPLDNPPFELLLKKATDLYAEFPPEKIESEVKDRMKRIQEENAPPPPRRSEGKSVIPKSNASNTGFLIPAWSKTPLNLALSSSSIAFFKTCPIVIFPSENLRFFGAPP